MCGIVGYMVKTSSLKHRDFFTQALYVDALRGTHGTGMATVHERTNEVKITKRGMCASDFLDSRAAEKHISDLFSAKVAIGHNRHATVGSHAHANAHPFESGDIVMVHNGSLRNYKNLPDHEYFEVDSEMICYSLNKLGAEETLKLLQGAFALVWWNKTDKTLNMVRNSERPLYVATNGENTSMFFASEGGIIKWIAGRNEMEVSDIALLPIGELHTFHFETSDNKIHHTSKPVEFYSFQTKQAANEGGKRTNPAWTADGVLSKFGLKTNDKITITFTGQENRTTHHSGPTKFVGYMNEEPWLPIYGYGYSKRIVFNKPYRAKITGAYGNSEKADDTQVIINIDSVREVIEVSDINKARKGRRDITVFDEAQQDKEDLKWIPGPNGKMFNQAEYRKLVASGCSNCACNLTQWDADTIAWAPGDNPVCEDCAPIVSQQITLIPSKARLN